MDFIKSETKVDEGIVRNSMNRSREPSMKVKIEPAFDSITYEVIVAKRKTTLMNPEEKRFDLNEIEEDLQFHSMQ